MSSSSNSGRRTADGRNAKAGNGRVVLALIAVVAAIVAVGYYGFVNTGQPRAATTPGAPAVPQPTASPQKTASPHTSPSDGGDGATPSPDDSATP